MNPFVNPGKRGVSLPPGCNDLIDVLQSRRKKLKAGMAASGGWESVVKPERFHTAGLSHVHRYVTRLLQPRTLHASLRIASLNGEISVLLRRSASEFSIYPLMALSNQERAVLEFFATCAIEPISDCLIGHPGATTRVLAFPLSRNASEASKLATDVMRAIYGLDNEAGLEFAYVEVATRSGTEGPASRSKNELT